MPRSNEPSTASGAQESNTARGPLLHGFELDVDRPFICMCWGVIKGVGGVDRADRQGSYLSLH